MAQQGKSDAVVTLQELAVSNAYEIAALVTVLERNSLPKQTAVREEITRPTAKTGTREHGGRCVEAAEGPRNRVRPMLKLGGVALVVLVLNLPFGYWRAGVRRFTLPWLLAVHAPVPLVVGVRLLTGLGWHLATVPVVALAFLAGQVLGGCVRAWGRGQSGTAA